MVAFHPPRRERVVHHAVPRRTDLPDAVPPVGITALDLDESMALWRSRHLNMVRRMIGLRMGTVAGTGSGYLKGVGQSLHLPSRGPEQLPHRPKHHTRLAHQR